MSQVTQKEPGAQVLELIMKLDTLNVSYRMAQSKEAQKFYNGEIEKVNAEIQELIKSIKSKKNV